MIPGRFNIVQGGQCGSESKGKLSSFLVRHPGPLASRFPVELVTMAASPNAGHTFIDDSGGKFVSYHLPIAGVVNSWMGGEIALGPTSVINPSIFVKELLDLHVDPGQVIIDPRATIINTSCLDAERSGECSSLSDIGSTLQGVGVARSRKLLRGHGGRVEFVRDNEQIMDSGIRVRHVSPFVHSLLMSKATVLHEMSQGFDLDLEHGISPFHCTSKMINTSMGMAELGIPPLWIGNVYGVIRPYPIRVNNRTGYSGSYGDDSQEISWEDVTRRCGCPYPVHELTTTTHLPRRVFEFSWQRYREFIRVCSPSFICLQFANYLDWGVYGLSDWEDVIRSDRVREFVVQLEQVGVPVAYIGTGPQDGQMAIAPGLSGNP